jgi:hypothetical protein
MLLAWFTLALVVLAALAGWQARSAAKAAWADLREQQERNRAAQASRVYSWPFDRSLNAARLKNPGVNVKNASDLPVYDVFVVIKDEVTGNHEELQESLVMPGEEVSLFVQSHVLTQTWGWIEHQDGYGNVYYSTPDHVQGPSFMISLRFRDASNQRWQRDPTGALSRASS